MKNSNRLDAMDKGVMAMNTLVCMGEALIDFIPLEQGQSLKDVRRFERAAGGAPANVAAAVAKLGGHAVLLTKLGNDAFGDFIVETLSRAQVDTKYIKRTSRANTALAFVSLSSDGNRSFSFYRNPSADLLFTASELDESLLKSCAVFHFGSVDLVQSPMKEAHRAAIALAKSGGALISFDPNVRLPLWHTPQACRQAILEFLPLADIVKVSDEELFFLFDTNEPAKAAEMLFSMGCQVFLYTKGAKGAQVYTKRFKVSSPGVQVPVFDTTGAGDSFMAAFLYQWLQKSGEKMSLAALSQEEYRRMAVFSNHYAAYTTMGKGGIDAMATKQQLKDFYKGKEEIFLL